jgi:release factor glutamine methyltransferase
MHIKDIIRKGTQTLSAAYPQEEAREMVFSYMEMSFGIKRYAHILNPDASLTQDQTAQAEDAFRRMASSEPLQYVTGKADFYGRVFDVSPAVLIPRPETEILCRNTLERIATHSGHTSPVKVLDLCTGSGCIAWTIALECHDAEVTAIDISDAALETASSQTFPEEQVKSPIFIKKDILGEPDERYRETFDILLSNPPYVMDSEKAQMRPNVLDHEPHLALFVSDADPLVFYRAIARWAETCLKPGGYGLVEINEALGQETARLFESAGFVDVEIIKDLNDKDRFVCFTRII